MLTFLHPLVDFCSVAVLAAGGITFKRWLAYNAIAFALQLPLGVAMDMMGACGRDPSRGRQAGVAEGRAHPSRVGFAVGCLLAAGGAVAEACGFVGWLPLCAACLGNALFHLTAGANVLERSPGKSGPIGLFISTGALGIMAGQMVVGGGRGATAIPAGEFAVVLGVAAALIAGAIWQTVRWREFVDAARAPRPRGAVVVVVLFVLVVWRSWAGLLAGGMSSGAGLAFVLAGSVVTLAGKAAGGYLADWRGRGTVTAISVAGSAALCFACSPSNVALWLVFLFVAQLATGPVLSLMYDKCGRRAGTAFGLNCFGLFMGGVI